MEHNDEALLAEVRSEAPVLQVPRFDHAIARRIGMTAATRAERDGLPVAIGVMRGAQRVFHAAFEGTTAEHDDWLRRKVNSAVLHEVPSLELVLRQRVAGRVPDWLDPHEYAVAGGAVPLFLAGSLVGVVVVSGLTETMRADHDLAMAAIHDAIGGAS
ncbi:heme-binding protein [Agromyces silvae]|uniref:heme-binding protein n=1 Tax=Agromyces silvae TaxID=3388266 RepID=UPI00280C1979|nr:heme-binding protein [Agromyces protaetiae]